MTTEWSLIQFTKDLRRREPRNVGVAVTGEFGEAIRMFGVDPATGAADGRRLRALGISRSDYEPWVNYFTAAIHERTTERLIATQHARPSNFRIVLGGITAAETPAHALADQLYAELVDDVAVAPPVRDWARELRTNSDSTLQLAEYQPSRDVEVIGRWDGGDESILFDYSVATDVPSYMSRVQLHHGSIEAARMHSHDFFARVTAARNALGPHTPFVSFYSGAAVDALGTDSVLKPLWQVSHSIDVDDPPYAATQLRQALAA